MHCPYQPGKPCALQVMMYAQLRDNNQGIIKITSGGMNRAANVGDIVVEKDTPLSALLNGANQPGMLVLSRATDMAMERAKASGFGIVGTHHTSTSTGALAYYGEKVRRRQLLQPAIAQSELCHSFCLHTERSFLHV